LTRVLLAGASGFVGGSVLRALLDRGHEVDAVARRGGQARERVRWHATDLLEPGAAEALVTELEPELMLDLAWYAEHGRFWDSTENLRWVDATLRLAHAFTEARGRRALIAGSCAEYAWGPALLRENDSALEPSTLYGAAKHATHVVAAALAAQGHSELVWGRLFFLYGPGEHPDRLVAAVARSLIAGERVATSEGAQVRDFMHVDDAARALVELLESPVTGAVNVASGLGVSVREVVTMIGELTAGLDHVDFGAIATRAGEPERLVADVARLREEVGFTPAIALRDGLDATVRWWREQPALP
jgi:nucleoside-diphosphate-sugar epimerase